MAGKPVRNFPGSFVNRFSEAALLPAAHLTRMILAGLMTTTLLLMTACDDLDTIAAMYESGSDSGSDSDSDSGMTTDTSADSNAAKDAASANSDTATDAADPAPVVYWDSLAYEICGARKIPGRIGTNNQSISHIVPTFPDGFAVATFTEDSDSNDDMSVTWFSPELSNGVATQALAFGGYSATLVALDNGALAVTGTRWNQRGSNALILLERPDASATFQVFQESLPGDADWQYASGVTELSVTPTIDGLSIVVVGEIEGNTTLGEGENAIALEAPSDRLSSYMAWYDLSGNLLNARLLDVSMMTNTIVARGDGSYLLTGGSTDVFGGTTMYVTAIDSEGEILWKNTGGNLSQPEGAREPVQSIPLVLGDGSFFVMGVHWDNTLIGDREGNEFFLEGPGADYLTDTLLRSSFVAYYDSEGLLQWATNRVVDLNNYGIFTGHGGALVDENLFIAGKATGAISTLPTDAGFIEMINITGESLGVAALPNGLTPVSAGHTGAPNIDMSVLALYEKDIEFQSAVPTAEGDVTIFPRDDDSNFIVLDLCNIAPSDTPLNVGCYHCEDTDADTSSQDPDGATISAATCTSETRGAGWPCMCDHQAICGDGNSCIGLDIDVGICTPTAPEAGSGMCDAYDAGAYGNSVVEVCGTYLSEDECLCLPEGCQTDADCPSSMLCVEIGCINDFPGCYVPNELDKRKVCFPDNY